MICTALRSEAQLADRQLIVLTCLPPGVGGDTLVETIAARVEAMNTGDPNWEPLHVGEWQLLHSQWDPPTAIPLAQARDACLGCRLGNPDEDRVRAVA